MNEIKVARAYAQSILNALNDIEVEASRVGFDRCVEALRALTEVLRIADDEVDDILDYLSRTDVPSNHDRGGAGQ